MTPLAPDELERGVLEQWEREHTFARSLEKRATAPRFSFYDGPPYATGSPHYGHILQTAIKDTVTRYWTMRGYLVDRRVGWDCHGLPVENLVEKELGLKSKKDIEAQGIEAFAAACRSIVLRHVDEFTSLLRRFGRWADYRNAYVTMDASFMESAWWVFKVAWDRGLVYQGMRSSPYCPRCETPLSNFETAQGYQEITDPAITVKLRLEGEDRASLLVWTTTPWTLPGNVAVAVNPDIRYIRVRVGSEHWIVAKERVADVVRAEHVIEDEFFGSALVGKRYVPPYRFFEPVRTAYRVVSAQFVTAAEGTGLVHVAPAFGEEDFQLSLAENLPLLRTVDTAGRFVPAVSLWAGRFVKEADGDIIKDLDARGQLLRAETIRHEYPHCWRCSTPLIYMAVDSWFIAVRKIKEQLLKNAEQIRWVPAHLQEGRFGQGLRDAPDWAVSRTRYWGIPLPVWQCTQCEGTTVIGSLQELRERGGDLALLRSPHADPDLHRPYIDRVVLRCAACGSEARRVPEVLDVWFDSGSMPYGQWHYPFENKEQVEKNFPADFVGEALEMTRGWFYTLHVLAGILTLQDLGLGEGNPAFRNVVASGLVLTEDGKKFSKRLKNYPDPADIIAKYGADTVRLYLLSTAALGEDYRFSDRLVGELYRRFTLILWNVWQYYLTYGGGREPGVGSRETNFSSTRHPRHLLDRWILARTAQLAADVHAAMEEYQVDTAARSLIPFVDDLSTWYVRRSRGRTEALPVLREALRQFSLIAAPFLPFLTEHIYQELTRTSPHLEHWPADQLPKLNGKTSEVGLLEQMQEIRALASAGQRARAEARIKVRQPLPELVLVGSFPVLEVENGAGRELLRDEVNVKTVRSVAEPPEGMYTWVLVPGGKLGLRTELTPELKAEGLVREVIRQVQDLRKRAGLTVHDRIELAVTSESPEVRDAVQRFGALLQTETRAGTILSKLHTVDAAENITVEGAAIHLALRRM